MTDASNLGALAFIGAGNMATALIRGLLADGVPPGQVHVADPVAEQRQAMAAAKVNTYEQNQDAAARADVVVLAVKPQLAAEVVQSLQLRSGQLLISIAAGINLHSLRRWTAEDQPLVRCMPNTPALLGAGITGLFANPACSPGQRQTAEKLLAAAGDTVWVAAEHELDAVTAVSGSGPAYFFLLMEAMVEAGTGLGLSRDTATRLTLQTAYGAALMARDSKQPPATLRANVTSPGGTTAAALEVLNKQNFNRIVDAALNAAEQRAAQLSEEFGR